VSFVLGVDGGNSKTIVMIARSDGEVAAVTRTGCGNHQGIGVEPAMAAIEAAVDGALRSAGLQRTDLAAACFALAGADFDEDFALLRPALAGRAFAPVWQLHNDTMAALRAGTENRDAVALIVGAGMNAAARNAEGEEARYLALGWKSGDWGGGGDIAEEAIRLSIQDWDGRGRPTALRPLVLRQLGVVDFDSLIRALYRREIPRARILGLVPHVLRAADAGDQVAIAIVRRAGEESAAMGTALMRRLGLLASEVDVVLTGSVLRAGCRTLVDTISDRIREAAPRANLVVPRDEPVVGAVLGALDLDGAPVDASVRQRLSVSAAAALVGHSRQVDPAPQST